jgi:hypothetical protein
MKKKLSSNLQRRIERDPKRKFEDRSPNDRWERMPTESIPVNHIQERKEISETKRLAREAKKV